MSLERPAPPTDPIRIPPWTPNAPPNFHPCPAPTSANYASPANSDGPLTNFGACPAATDTYPGPPEPREPPPLFPIFATHHQLNTLVPPTYFGVSRQPRGNLRSPMIPLTYQRSTILDHNRHPPPPSSSAKPRRHSRHTPKSSSIPLAPYVSTNSAHAPRPKHSYDNSDPHSPLGPETPQALETPYPAPTPPPSPEKPPLTLQSICVPTN
ncbi:hypothetical protein E4T56_gene4658 [Termitomyces sp. T112]|nr:hypothetical protein E4T56_gene4658 [Termitomyces sp. T112]